MTFSDEQFTPEQEAILKKFVTNTSGSIFAIFNLPEVIKGALFSRYSRSTLGLRSLLLREFIQNQDESAFQEIVGGTEQSQDQLLAIKKAQNFYDRILDGYGDDSIGELGGAHLAVENVSMIAAKAIEDCRIGGSPLEKSTRYVYFDQKVNDQYLYHREAVLMTSAWKSLYENTCNMLFDTYSRLHTALSHIMNERFPRDPEVSKSAHASSIRAKVLDCVRGLLPASALTNLGLFGNGRFYETLLHKLQTSNLAELRDIGKNTYEELVKVVPSFVRRAEAHHKTHKGYADFQEEMHEEIQTISNQIILQDEENTEPRVTLIDYDPNAPLKVAAGILYPTSHLSFSTLVEYCRSLEPEELDKILESAAHARRERRHKSPRGLENAQFTFEFIADFGVYRDLQRHRLLTQDRQLLTCNHGYFIPEELLGTDLEKEYRSAMDAARTAHETIASELPEEAQYVVPMAYNVRWYWTANLREMQWLTELRSQPAGHISYRRIAQQMADAICDKMPAFQRFFAFVDHSNPDIGRLGQEVSIAQKTQNS